MTKTKTASATAEKTKDKAPPEKRRLKMLALQNLVHGNVLVPAGNVYWGNYTDLPPAEVAVPADPDAKVGEVEMPPTETPEEPPPWTSTGWNRQEHRSQGRNEADETLTD